MFQEPVVKSDLDTPLHLHNPIHMKNSSFPVGSLKHPLL